ncbi:WNT1-inducible-signaling pathway protein 1-like [Photinus pyralis]|uniref:WNT1-inducible-signaling pathway protein 1-like n=1 Tax=Photinus pyralis TaxID=7054 RepID=UPI00126718B1|nr:WNT1-inducible-signaling pathway protein 1-like [Photinus pyralis]
MAAPLKVFKLLNEKLIFQENCTYSSCTCPENQPCEECLECPRQVGEPCSPHKLCDSRRGIFCRYRHGDIDGICQESGGLPCLVYNKTYEHGETFTLDCRTQCTCQNGTYGCSSLCPQERISPKGTCKHPRLVDVPGQCCREWMCDSQTVEEPPSCQPIFSKWSTCSSDCGAGLSSRRSNLNAKCEPSTETRICQTRRCDDFTPDVVHRNEHHVRRGHECKATHRIGTPVTLRFGPCRSRKRYKPKYCGFCSIPGVSCESLLSTTVRIEFFCRGSPSLSTENLPELLPEFLEPGEDMWTDESSSRKDPHMKILTVSVQWILKCRCQRIPMTPTLSTGEIILHRVHRTAAP